MDGAQHRRTFHGRRRGKALRPTQRRHLAEILPRLLVPGLPSWAAPAEASSSQEGNGGGPDRPVAALDPATILPDSREVWLEIGFGGGEHLHALALAHPDIGFIGCEPFVNGVAMLMGKVAERDPGTIRVHPGDARDLIDALAADSIGRVYLLYPDPWPKARHHKRRFASEETLRPLARVMAPGAELRLATDIPDYAEHAAAAAAAGPFEPVVAAAPGWFAPWPGWVPTRYEAKALREGRRPHYLVWRRR